MEQHRQHFPEWLRQARINTGMSQANLAERVGVDERTVSRWERGRSIPRPYYNTKLQAVLGQFPFGSTPGVDIRGGDSVPGRLNDVEKGMRHLADTSEYFEQKYREALQEDPRIAFIQILDMKRPLELLNVYVRLRIHEDARLRYTLSPPK